MIKKIVSRIYHSENKFENAFSWFWSIIRYQSYHGSFIKSVRVYYKNEGVLKVKNGSFFLGFLSNRIGMSPSEDGVLRIYKGGEVVIDGDVRIARSCKVYVAGNLCIGNGTYVNPNTLIFARTNIIIGCHCAISWNCQIIDDDFHRLTSSPKSAKPIIIEDNVWIGSNVTILKGVTIGAGAVLAASSLIVKDVPKNSLVGGNPAKLIKEGITWE